MKILYHHRTLGDGAEGVHINELVQAFRDLGHDVRIVSLVGESTNSSTPKERRWSWLSRSLPSAAYELAEIMYNFVGIRMIMQAVKKFQPDVIYDRYNSYSTAAIKAGRLANLPIILEVNAPVAFERTAYSFRQLKFSWLAYHYERRICSGADQIVTVSTALKEYLLETYKIDPEKVSVFPNAINPKMFSVSQRDGGIREMYGLNQKIIVGFVGSLRAWHGIDVLMKVIPEVVAKERRAHFLIVGAGELHDAFQEFVQANQLENNLTMTGWVSRAEIPSHIAAMDITLMPNSNFYGSPIKVFEYMGMGKPTIAPRLPPLEEVITDGENAVLVDPGNEDALREAILDLIKNPSKRETIGKNASSHILRNHTWAKNASGILDVVRERLILS